MLLSRLKHSYMLAAKITSDINNLGYFIIGWGHFINRWFTGVYNTLILLLRSIKLHNSMEDPIPAQKMTLTVLSSFFFK